MRILAVDDEAYALKALRAAIERAAPGVSVACFSSPEEALAHCEREPPDVAFLDVEMGEMDGVAMAKRLKERHPPTNIVFVTAHADYMGEAFSLRASGYLLKPVRSEKVRVELENLRNPIPQRRTERVRIQCFGGFEVFVDGKPLLFSRSKPKELLAFLVNQQGSGVTAAKIASILWEDKAYNRSLQKQTQTVISQLMAILRQAGIAGIIRKSWNSIAIDTARFRCDYYDFLRGDVGALNAYTGEYMSDYSWAEFTTGRLTQAKFR